MSADHVHAVDHFGRCDCGWQEGVTPAAADRERVPEGWRWKWCDCTWSEYGLEQHPVFVPADTEGEQP